MEFWNAANREQAFTARVMAGIVGTGVATKAATAAAATSMAAKATGTAAGVIGTAAKGIASTGISAGTIGGVAGGVAGSVGGLLGGWLGYWLPAQLAPTEMERQLVLERGRWMLRLSVYFIVALIALVTTFIFVRFSPVVYAVALTALILVFNVIILVQCIRTALLVRELRRRVKPADNPNKSALRSGFKEVVGEELRPDRCWTSAARLFGLPLVDVQMTHPLNFHIDPELKQKTARGWVAIGDRATGILFAGGGFAKGIIAVGGCSVGVVALGGLAIGALSLGGGAIGGIAIGGGALGWDAAGGAAIGLHSAAGGLAVAYRAAFGGGAFAWEYAVGGGAMAAECNTVLANEVIERDTLKWIVEWINRNLWLVVGGSILFSAIPVCMFKWSKNDNR